MSGVLVADLDRAPLEILQDAHIGFDGTSLSELASSVLCNNFDIFGCFRPVENVRADETDRGASFRAVIDLVASKWEFEVARCALDPSSPFRLQCLTGLLRSPRRLVMRRRDCGAGTSRTTLWLTAPRRTLPALPCGWARGVLTAVAGVKYRPEEIILVPADGKVGVSSESDA